MSDVEKVLWEKKAERDDVECWSSYDLSRMIRMDSLKRQHLYNGLKMREPVLGLPGRRESQDEERAIAIALKQEHAW